jgi:hypothetical protein
MAADRILLGLVAAWAALAPGVALASGDDVRAAGSCGAGATSSVRLDPGGGRIDLRFEARMGRGSPRWRVVVVQERRIVWRGRVRAHDGRVRVRRSLADLPGVDGIRVTASGPGGVRCVAAATLRG